MEVEVHGGKDSWLRPGGDGGYRLSAISYRRRDGTERGRREDGRGTERVPRTAVIPSEVEGSTPATLRSREAATEPGE